MKWANPYTRVPGYKLAKNAPLAGDFVLQSSYAPGLGIGAGSKCSWAVTSIKRHQVIYAKSLRAAKDLLARVINGCGLDNWDYEFKRAGPLGQRAEQPYLFSEGGNASSDPA